MEDSEKNKHNLFGVDIIAEWLLQRGLEMVDFI